MSLQLTHWEFSFQFHTSNLTEATRTQINPFTGEPIAIPIDNGLTEDETRRMLQVFEENGINGPEADGEGYAVYGSKGDSIRFRCSNLDDSIPVKAIACEVVVRELSDEVLAIIVDVARAGNMVLTSCTGDCARVVGRSLDAKVLTRWPDAEPLSSVDELRAWLQGTIGGRKAHVPA